MGALAPESKHASSKHASSKSCGKRDGFIIHKVDPIADSLVGISLRYGVSKRKIKQFNDFPGVRGTRTVRRC